MCVLLFFWLIQYRGALSLELTHITGSQSVAFVIFSSFAGTSDSSPYFESKWTRKAANKTQSVRFHIFPNFHLSQSTAIQKLISSLGKNARYRCLFRVLSSLVTVHIDFCVATCPTCPRDSEACSEVHFEVSEPRYDARKMMWMLAHLGQDIFAGLAKMEAWPKVGNVSKDAFF